MKRYLPLEENYHLSPVAEARLVMRSWRRARQFPQLAMNYPVFEKRAWKAMLGW